MVTCTVNESYLMQVLESMCHGNKNMLEDKQPSPIIHISVYTLRATPAIVTTDLISTAALIGHRIVMSVPLQSPMEIHTQVILTT